MSRKLTTEEIKERIFELVGGEYELLSEYVNSQTKFKVKHVACSCVYETLWNNFKKGARCPKCAGNYRYTDNEITKLVSEMTNGEYTKLSTYKNANTKFKMRHSLCGNEYMVRWNSFLQGRRCPKCANLTRKNKLAFTNEDIVKAMYKLVGDEYTKMDDTYINAQTKFKIKHSKCDNEYMVSWSNFQSGYRCPRCSSSKGEKFIQKHLTNHNISFATQVRFSDCKYKKTLPFDFGILDDNKRVIALIEFDGIQHFEPVEIWGGQEALQQTQLRDRVKDDYCKEHKIPLLRIRFDEDIEEKLNFFLTQERVKV